MMIEGRFSEGREGRLACTPHTHSASQVVERRAGGAAYDLACRPCVAYGVERGVKLTQMHATAHRKRRRASARSVVRGEKQQRRHRSHISSTCTSPNPCVVDALFRFEQLFFWNFLAFPIGKGVVEVG